MASESPSAAAAPNAARPRPHIPVPARSFRESLFAVLGISIVTMLVAVDQTVVGTALPRIVAELHGFELYAWVATAYLLTSVVTVPIFGRLGDYFGRKPFLLASIVVFSLASALCGMANSMLFLVLARALQGIGGGMLVGTAFACIPDLFPDPHQRLRWQVILTSLFGVANAIGPSLGGYMTEYFGWRSTFYVNLPIGLAALLIVGRCLPRIRPPRAAQKIKLDWPGAGLVILTLGAFQLLVELLPQHGLTPFTTGLLGVTLVAGWGLWRWERRCPQPLLPFEMLHDRRLAGLFLLSLLSGFTMFSMLFFTPLLFQGGFGMSPDQAGLVITPLVVCITVGSIINGRIITRLANPKRMFYVGYAFLMLSCLGVTFSSRATPEWALMTFLLLGGVGFGFVMPNITVFGQLAAGPSRLGIVTAMVQSLRMVGGMLGTALTGTMVTQLYAHNVSRTLEGGSAGRWYSSLSDPQVLVDHAAQTRLLQSMTHAGIDGNVLLDTARRALVGSLHMGLGVAALVAAVCIWRVVMIPHLELKRRGA